MQKEKTVNICILRKWRSRKKVNMGILFWWLVEIQSFPWERKYEQAFDEEEYQNEEMVDQYILYDVLSGRREELDLQRRRQERASRIDYPVKRDIFRSVVLVLDHSSAMSETDFKPSRLEVIVYQLKEFVRMFFRQNSLSMLSIIISHNRKASLLTPLSRKPSLHLRALDVCLFTPFFFSTWLVDTMWKRCYI